MPRQRRKTMRSRLWFDARAIVKFDYGTIRGIVHNLGARGMFLRTSQRIPEYSKVEVKIMFHSKVPSVLSGIKGTVIWCTDKGIGIRFTKVDLDRFRGCVTSIMKG